MVDVNKTEYRTLFDRYVVEFKAGRSELSEGAMNGANGHAQKRALFDYIALWLGADAFELKIFNPTHKTTMMKILKQNTPK